MVVLIWMLTVLALIIILGEVRYRIIEYNKKMLLAEKASLSFKDSMDMDMDNLAMENINGDFVQLQSLEMRGSWRLAQSRYMAFDSFINMRDEEYGRKL